MSASFRALAVATALRSTPDTLFRHEICTGSAGFEAILQRCTTSGLMGQQLQ